MIIGNLTTRIVTRVYESRFRNPHMAWTQKSAVLVFLETEAGVTGVGEAWCDAGDPNVVARYIEADLFPLLKGQSVDRPAAIAARMKATNKMGLRGSALYAAMSAVDIAVWDAYARTLRQPLWKLLGGVRDRVPVYASGGFYAPGYTPDDLVRDMLKGMELGCMGLKTKAGMGDLDEEEARMSALRAAIGPSAWLMADFLFAPERHRAIEVANVLKSFNLRFLEAPTALEDFEGWRDIRQRTGMAISGPEVASSLQVFRQAIEVAGVDFLQADAIICGGVTEAMRIAALGAAHYRPFSLHCSGSAISLAINAQIAAAAPTGDSLEIHLLHQTLFNRLWSSGYAIRDGYLHLPDTPGHGLEIAAEDPELADAAVSVGD